MVSQFLFYGIIGLLSLVVLVKSSDYAVLGITNYAKKLGLSDYIIGLLVVSLGASIPELVSSVTGSSLGDNGIIFGTLLGSAICNFGFVLGILAIYGKNINVKNKLLGNIKFLIMVLIMMPVILSLDGVISRIDGVILILLWISYLVFLWMKEGRIGKLKKDVKIKFIWKDSLIFLIALVAILLSGRWLVVSSVKISFLLSIPTFFIASTVIAIGASIPDLTVSIRSLMRGHNDVGLGDLMGGALNQCLLYFGILALVNPIQVTIEQSIVVGGFLFAILFLVMLYMRKNQMTWRHGINLILVYIGFLLVQVALFI